VDKCAQKEELSILNTKRSREIALWGLRPGSVSLLTVQLGSLPGPRAPQRCELGLAGGPSQQQSLAGDRALLIRQVLAQSQCQTTADPLVKFAQILHHC